MRFLMYVKQKGGNAGDISTIGRSDRIMSPELEQYSLVFDEIYRREKRGDWVISPLWVGFSARYSILLLIQLKLEGRKEIKF